MEIKYSRNEIKKACNILKTILGIEYATRDINTKDGVIDAMENIVHKYIIKYSKNGNQIEDRITELERKNLRYISINNHLETLYKSLLEENELLREQITRPKTFLQKIFG